MCLVTLDISKCTDLSLVNWMQTAVVGRARVLWYIHLEILSEKEKKKDMPSGLRHRGKTSSRLFFVLQNMSQEELERLPWPLRVPVSIRRHWSFGMRDIVYPGWVDKEINSGISKATQPSWQDFIYRVYMLSCAWGAQEGSNLYLSAFHSAIVLYKWILTPEIHKF